MPAFPLIPNWRNSVEETYEFLTAIASSRADREQRSRRRTVPRRSWSYEAMANSSIYRNATRMLDGQFDELSYIANPVEAVELAALADASDTVIVVDTIQSWFAPGSWLVLYGRNGVELVQTASNVGVTVTLVDPLVSAWPAGTKVHMAELGRFGRDTKLKMVANQTAVYNITFDVDIATGFVVGPQGTDETFDGRELWLKKPNWSEGVAVDFVSGQEDVDYGQGLKTAFDPVPFLARTNKAIFVGRDKAEAVWVRDFFLRMYGRAGEFFMPTWNNDLVPIANLTSGAAILRTAGTDDYYAYNDPDRNKSALVNKCVIVFLKDGTYLTRKINTVTTSGGNTNFNMTANWSATKTPDEVAYVSFLPLCRFGTDALTIEWMTNTVAQYSLAIRTLEYLVATA